MNWQTFKDTLLLYPEANLQFEYAPQKWVDASYHLTEIKQIDIHSVDCGGKSNEWQEIVLQVWEPYQGAEEKAMTAEKAFKIIEMVEQNLALNSNAEFKIEFGNIKFPIQQLLIADIILEGHNLVLKLTNDKTQCKALLTDETACDCAPKVADLNLPQVSCC